ncbi:hypothetical protein F53441_5051 [Fusarium austroafricanum]|uniref:Uncharacterized protein n=1 Tax=Fusarium austroafricanum TaxID=2364996 RepID=A0A8H4KMR9_9HYPO|nr:hypothetical protein F53441_5051 [Fusarium austroafricanum]
MLNAPYQPRRRYLNACVAAGTVCRLKVGEHVHWRNYRETMFVVNTFDVRQLTVGPDVVWKSKMEIRRCTDIAHNSIFASSQAVRVRGHDTIINIFRIATITDMILNDSASVIANARDHNVHVFVTLATMDNPRLSVEHITAKHMIAKMAVREALTVTLIHVLSQAASERGVSADVINGLWVLALEGGYFQAKGWGTPSTKTVSSELPILGSSAKKQISTMYIQPSTTEEEAVEDPSEASVIFPTARHQGLENPSSALITSAL